MGAAGGGRPRRLAPGGGPMDAKNASGGRKHIDESFPGTGTVPGRAGWTAGRRSCEAKHTPQRGGMASEKLGGAYTCCEVFDQLRLGREGVVWGSSEKFMSDDPNSSPFLAQRRGGAEKNQEEPHNIPMLIRLDMGMGDEPCIHFSAPPRLRAKINTTWHPRHEVPGRACLGVAGFGSSFKALSSGKTRPRFACPLAEKRCRAALAPARSSDRVGTLQRRLSPQPQAPRPGGESSDRHRSVAPATHSTCRTGRVVKSATEAVAVRVFAAAATSMATRGRMGAGRRLHPRSGR